MFKPGVRTVVAISLGAIAGSLCRYCVGWGIGQWLGTSIPYGTFVINLTGCFAMGLFANLSQGQLVPFHPELRLWLLTGFLGSYTTFSSYELDSAQLLLHRNVQTEQIYWLGSLFLGLMSLRLGGALAEWFLHKRA